jgi:hypothetical protein
MIVISVVGIILSVYNWLNQVRGVRELRFWSSVCRVIEEEEDYFGPLKSRDLVYVGYMKWRYNVKDKNGKVDSKYVQENKSEEHKSAPLSGFMDKISFSTELFHEWTTFRYIIPGVFLILWVTGLVCTFVYS